MDIAGIHLPTALSAGTTFAVIQGFFWHLEKIQSRDNRRFVGRWLMRMTPADAKWTTIVLELFTNLFGASHWRLRCFLVSCVMTLTAWAFAAWEAYRLQGPLDQTFPDVFGGWIVLFGYALVACVFDYLSLWVTRLILWKASHVTRWIGVLGFVLLDLCVSFALFSASSFLMLVVGRLILLSDEHVDWSIVQYTASAALTDWEVTLIYHPPVLWLCLAASLITSAWLWGYLIAAQIVRFSGHLPKVILFLAKVIDIREHPVRSLGTVIALFSAGAVGVLNLL